MAADCQCTVCGRNFEYGDEWSPMLSNRVWNRCLNFYGLHKHEKDAEILFNKRYDRWRDSGYSDDYLLSLVNAPECHTYLCYPCIEKVLGRKIKKSDLIAEDVPLNKKFEEIYFSDEDKDK